MSERKVLQKYYPPTFDPSAIARTRKPKGSAAETKKLPTVRLMAPFPMRCTSCGEFIYKGRKFNARKETTDETYLRIPIYRFWIKCTACASSISFKTNPKTMDYDCESGAQRSFERWRDTSKDDADKLETEEQMVERLEQEAAMAEASPMAELEQRVEDAKTEMEIADALDEIRVRNARILRAEGKDATEGEGGKVDDAVALAAAAERRRREEEEAEDERAARRAFGRGNSLLVEVEEEEKKMKSTAKGSGLRNEILLSDDADPDPDTNENEHENEDDTNRETTDLPPPPPAIAKVAEAPAPAPAEGAAEGGLGARGAAGFTAKRTIKKKKDFAAALGIKRKPALV